MKKVFHFEAPREHYTCDAAVVWCFDHRFELSFRKFLTRAGVTPYDAIKIAGGAKVLVTPDRESDREFVLGQIRTSMRLHRTHRVILMVHSDCGAYGGLDAFGRDTAAEAEHHGRELQIAAANLKAAIPQLEVQGYFVDFDGVWDAEIGPTPKLQAKTTP